MMVRVFFLAVVSMLWLSGAVPVATLDENQLSLPGKLREVSGICFDAHGRLFAHNDELGMVCEVDPDDGSILKSFYITSSGWYGTSRIAADFEDIAIVGTTFFLVDSSGTLYMFEEGDEGVEVEAVKFDTFLTESWDVEGLCVDPVGNRLFLACKVWPKRQRPSGVRGVKPVFSFSLDEHRLAEDPGMLIPSATLKNISRDGRFKPSAITRHPLSGNFLVLASAGHMVAELDSNGRLLSWRHLDAIRHPQPEGIAVDSLGRLYIADEDLFQGRLTRYPSYEMMP